MNWLYENKEMQQLSDFPESCVGFVYLIQNKDNGRIYVGKKILHNNLTKKLTKKETEAWAKPGRVPKKKKEVKESNWQSYYGSSKTLLEDITNLGKEGFERQILRPCFSKKEMSYYEVYYQMKYEVLHVDSYNENISGKWFRKDTGQILEQSQDSPETVG
jgi:hypothetical protein